LGTPVKIVGQLLAISFQPSALGIESSAESKVMSDESKKVF
jgi:hypothetical protein